MHTNTKDPLIRHLGPALAAAAFCAFSPIGMACVQPPAAAAGWNGGSATLTANQKYALTRIEGMFRRLKSAPVRNSRSKNDATPAPVSMAGMWMTTFTSGGETVDAGFDVWNADGTQILNDFVPPVSGAVCLGVWAQTGDFTYQLKHPSWVYDDAGVNVVGTVYILEQVLLDPGGYSYTGTFSYEGYDLDGNHIYHLDGEISGDRIDMTPPPGAGPLDGSSPLRPELARKH